MYTVKPPKKSSSSFCFGHLLIGMKSPLRNSLFLYPGFLRED